MGGSESLELKASVADMDDLPDALRRIGLSGPRPVVVVIGGAGRMTEPDARRLRAVLAEVAIPVLPESGAAVIDGGTDVGVMRLMGRARTDFPLIGVVAEATVILPDRPAASADAAPLEPHHSHFLLVPGRKWGDEAHWLARTATV